MVETRILAKADIYRGIKKTYIDTLFATDDTNAHRFDIQLLMNNQAAVIPAGVAVTGYFIRYCDNATISLNGSLEGNVVSVTLKEACYRKSGQFALIIKLVSDDVTNTVFYGEGNMYVSVTDTILDEENIIPSLDDLLKQIAVMEAGTKAANTAANQANSAATNADNATANANNAAAKIDGMTVSAEKADEAEAIITEKNGVKHISFKLPKGDTGATGPKGDGLYAFHIDENGHLICTYDTATPPPISINADGHLIYTVSGQTIDLGKVVG